MMHPKTERRFISEKKGFGVVATEALPKGTMVWVQDCLDQVFPPARWHAIGPPVREVLDTYSFRDATGAFVFCWDHARYVNHSFRPNCMITPFAMELAIRDIAPGEELTDDYGTLNIVEPFYPEEEGESRTVVLPDDLKTYGASWDPQVLAAFSCLDKVPQPLQAFLTEEVWGHCLDVARSKRSMPSLTELWCGSAAIGSQEKGHMNGME
jgi:hypothetical protein